MLNRLNVMRCAIWYHLHNLKNMKNTHGGVLLLVKLQALFVQFKKREKHPWRSVTLSKVVG